MKVAPLSSEVAPSAARDPPVVKTSLCSSCTVLYVLVGAVVLVPVAVGVVSLLWVLALPLLVVVVMPVAVVADLWLGTFLNYNDLYTKLIMMAYRRRFTTWKVPTAKKDMDPRRLRPRDRLKLAPLAYALNIVVPEGNEEEFERGSNVTGAVAGFIEAHMHRLPMRIRRHCEFAAGEDPVRFVMRTLGEIYPPVHDLWVDKTSDDALTRLCFFGLGAHRIKVVEESSSSSKKKWFVVETNALADLPVESAFETYGGDAFFDFETWRIAKIVRREPRSKRALGRPNAESVVRTYRPGDAEWDYVKFCFRSSLFTLVTLVDHLYGIHMVASNSVTIAARESFEPEHPIRRFLVPFSFQTISVNDDARHNLVNPRSMGPRNFAFSDVGLRLAWAAAPQLDAIAHNRGPTTQDLLTDTFDREAFILHMQASGVQTPYYDQALDYYRILKRFVQGYVDFYYPSSGVGNNKNNNNDNAIRADDDLMRFLQYTVFATLEVSAADKVAKNGVDLDDLDATALKKLLVDVLASYVDVVTAGHEQCGSVPQYAQDASFCAFRWTPGKLAGNKQTAICQALLMAFTSIPMPRLLADPGSDGDWTHLYLHDPKTKACPGALTDLFAAFQSDLTDLSRRCDAYDAAAAADESSHAFPHTFGLKVFNPKYLETSVSV